MVINKDNFKYKKILIFQRKLVH